MNEDTQKTVLTITKAACISVGSYLIWGLWGLGIALLIIGLLLRWSPTKEKP